MKQSVITLLGSTGSIGRSTLDIIKRHPDSCRVYALTADSNIESLAAQCLEFKPRYAVVSNQNYVADFKKRLASNSETEVLAGDEGLEQIVVDPACDTVVAGITGIAGLAPVLSAARSGKRILLANKEALIAAGKLLMDTARENHATLFPIDSEHCGLFQCLGGKTDDESISKVILTASGGPFLRKSPAELKDVSPQQACAHPNWEMGRKISVDSATMMNKGLEVIEAHWLFNVPFEKIEVLIHPQSIVHALVEFKDGSQLAQLSKPDMRISIACALAWPNRMDSGVSSLDLADCGNLEFERPDLNQFPCLGLAYRAMRQGSAAVIALNAANEAAVTAFLDGNLSFNHISKSIEHVIQKMPEDMLDATLDSLAAVLEIDQMARKIALHKLRYLWHSRSSGEA